MLWKSIPVLSRQLPELHPEFEEPGCPGARRSRLKPPKERWCFSTAPSSATRRPSSCYAKAGGKVARFAKRPRPSWLIVRLTKSMRYVDCSRTNRCCRAVRFFASNDRFHTGMSKRFGGDDRADRTGLAHRRLQNTQSGRGTGDDCRASDPAVFEAGHHTLVAYDDFGGF